LAPPPHLIYTFATGRYVTCVRILAQSLRVSGSPARLVVFTDGRPVPEADVCRTLPWDYRRRAKFSPERWWIKFYLLKELAQETDGYLVFMDSDVWARRPFDLSPLLVGEASAFLENDLADYPEAVYVDLTCREVLAGLRELGFEGRALTLNAGLFAVRSDAVPRFLEHVYRSKRVFLNEQQALTYAVCSMNPDAPRIDRHRDLYDSNDIPSQVVSDVLDGKGWQSNDYLSGKPVSVDPALVHYAGQKRAFVDRLAPTLPKLSAGQRVATGLGRVTGLTFAGPLNALGLWESPDSHSIPRRAMLNTSTP
jgi:hypothetical protein